MPRIARHRRNLAPLLLFVLALFGTPPLSAAVVTRGPYLQLGTSSSVVVRWRTDTATDSRVRYGTDPANLSLVADVPAVTTEHSVKLTGLAAHTAYSYSVGTLTGTLASGVDQRFTTAPTPGTSAPTRVWVIGDAGTGTASQTQVRNAYNAFTGSRGTDLWLMLGDNAYQSGTDPEYQANVFNVYTSTLKSAVVWPAVGNHDTNQSTNFDPSIPYYSIFTLPAAAEAGGAVSGTEAYYSFDYGNIHFVCLDSMTSDRGTTAAMATWLKADLGATTREWVIAFWHHPPYSKGSHDSDTDLQMSQMRQNIVPILESYGVDLVMTGHSHSYERTFLIDGHYGTSTTFGPSNLKDGGSGQEDGTGAYRKATDGVAPHQGAVYAVAGSSGQTSGGTLNHPAMFVSFSRLGSMVLDVDGQRLDAKFIRETGGIDDHFTILKGNTPPAVTLTSPANNATFNAPATVGLAATASDPGGSVAKVDFYANGNPVGSDATNPYAINWTNVAAGSYTLTAVATDNLGLTKTSGPVSITVNAVPVPAAPTNLTATATSTPTVNLAWADNSSNETGFKVERSTDGGGSFTTVLTTGMDAQAAVDSSVSAATTYVYRVRATNAAGDSPPSNTATVSTSRSVPAAPSGLAGVGLTKSTIKLTWVDNSTNETSFTLQRGGPGGSFLTIATLAPGITTFTDSGLAGNKSYTYRVAASNTAGTSAFSNTATVKTPKK